MFGFLSKECQWEPKRCYPKNDSDQQHVTRFDPYIQTPTYSPRDDDGIAFMPFCCQQQLKGGIPRIGIVFICQVEDADEQPNIGEVRKTFWVKLEALRKIVEDQPERIFTLQLPVLNYYLKRRSE